MAGRVDASVGMANPVGTVPETMSAVRKPCVMAIVVVALTLAACTTTTVGPQTSTSSTSTTTTTQATRATAGVVTGVAQRCLGLPPPPNKTLYITVRLYSDRSLVASVTIRSGARYRFSVIPGSYRVNVQPYFPKPVVVRTGRVVTANFYNYCL